MKRINLLTLCLFILCLCGTNIISAVTDLDHNTKLDLCPAPIINNFMPLSGPENTLITITGSNFNSAATVSIDGIDMAFTVLNDAEITAFIPSGLTSNANILIESNGGCVGTSSDTFTLVQSDCSTADIYISEIYDAYSGDYAVIELYNPSASPVVIDNNYVIVRYGDVGNATPNNTFDQITGTIPPMDTFVIQMGSGNNCSPLDVDFNISTGINDNDEFKLYNNGVLIDVVNSPDERGYTVIRNANAPIPQTTYDISDWFIDSNENCANLGSHTANPIPDNTPNLTQPSSVSICENGTATFTANEDSGSATYQWNYLNASGNWVNLTDNATYQGSQTSTLTVLNATLALHATQYYCEMTTSSCTLVSNAAQLFVENPNVDTLADQTVCTSYTLPTLTDGNYYTGTNGTGTALFAGDIITTSQTLYIYNEVGTAPNNCSNESSFEVSVNGTPNVDTLADQNVCTSYTLPNLTEGNYYTGTNGSGTALFAGDIITSSQTLYIYNEVGTAPNNCSNESSFEVIVNGTPNVDTLADQNVCTSYTLPNLTDGNYYTGTNGSGTALFAGDVITSSQTLYIYNEVGTAPNNCSNESSFEVIVNGTPNVDTLADQTVCASYTLPSLTDGNYYTGTNGSGTALFAGDSITSSQTLYIYNEVGTAPDNCTNESSFEVIVNGTVNVDTLADQTVCASYTLPSLTDGNYYTGTNGSGTALFSGDVITSSQILYIYNEVGTAPDNCTNESNFTIEILPSTDFTLEASNIALSNNTLTVNMTDLTLDYSYAVDNSSFQTSNVFTNLAEGAHTLYVTDANGCITKSLAFNITFDLIIPPFFTPNGDTVNDYWRVIDRNQVVKEILIFNRYGKLITQLIPTTSSWDGFYKGHLLEANDFWYLITLKTGEQLRGHFALKH
ncbi:T9SS type B sorting domain-containing protein [Winogradskyella rapida]|uniref:T9SS type B sorting domain-containing protein n=1 Tax=Winogradskyella rapida TaxID=549701 RepID=A0ABW3KSS5_9FLAO